MPRIYIIVPDVRLSATSDNAEHNRNFTDLGRPLARRRRKPRVLALASPSDEPKTAPARTPCASNCRGSNLAGILG